MKTSNFWIIFICFFLFSLVSLSRIADAQQPDKNDDLQQAAPKFPAQEKRAEIIKQIYSGLYIDEPPRGAPPRPKIRRGSVSVSRANALLNIIYTEKSLSAPAWGRAIMLFAAGSNRARKGLELQKLYAKVGLIAKTHVETRYVPDDEPLPESAIRGHEVALTFAIIDGARIIIDDSDARLLLETIARKSPYEIIRKAARQALENKY
jgi:hypothetical protein